MNETITNDYDVEVDNVDEGLWSELLLQFNDATLYQTWASGVMRRGEGNLSHLILKKKEQVVGICQITLTKIPLLKTGFADVYRGPVWRKKGTTDDIDIFCQMITTLKNEYAIRQGLMLRLWPNEFKDSENKFIPILEQAGFKNFSLARLYRTLLLDLSPPLEDLRKNLSKTWRRHLNHANKNNLRIIEGTNDKLFSTFLYLLKEMLARKKFVPRLNYDSYRLLQKKLPENLKMKIMVCELDGDPLCSIVCPAIGDTGLYLLGSSGDNGMKLHGSNLLHWSMVKYLKEQGYRWYDLGGIDPEGTPGTYQFKKGLAGKLGRDATHIGQFNLYSNPRSFIVNTLINTFSFLREKIYRLREHIKR